MRTGSPSRNAPEFGNSGDLFSRRQRHEKGYGRCSGALELPLRRKRPSRAGVAFAQRFLQFLALFYVLPASVPASELARWPIKGRSARAHPSPFAAHGLHPVLDVDRLAGVQCLPERLHGGSKIVRVQSIHPSQLARLLLAHPRQLQPSGTDVRHVEVGIADSRHLRTDLD